MNDNELGRISAEIDALKLLIDLANKCTKYSDVPRAFEVAWVENENKFTSDASGQIKASGKDLACTPKSRGEFEHLSEFETKKRKFLDTALEFLPRLEEAKAKLVGKNKASQSYAKAKDVFMLLITLISLLVSIRSCQKSDNANQLSQDALRLNTSTVEIELEKQFQDCLAEFLKHQSEIRELADKYSKRKINKSEFERRKQDLVSVERSDYKALERVVERYKAVGRKSRNIVEQFEGLRQTE